MAVLGKPVLGRGDWVVLPRADWMQDAACREVDPEWFFSDDRHDQAKAILTCEVCPVMAPCLEYALLADHDGVWAGYLPEELDALRRRRSA